MPLLYSILLIASVLFYILYEHAFSFYLFAFLLATPIVQFILTLYTAKRTDVSFTDLQNTASRASKLPLRIRVVNNSLLPCANLYIEIEYYNMLEGQKNTMKINTPVYPKESHQMTLHVSGVHCGTVRFRIKKCKVSDMLRLFSIKLRYPHEEEITKNCTLTILPDYTPLENGISNYSEGGIETDEYSKTTKGDDPSEIFDIRDYIEGDKMNRIHWKLTAKQNKTMVKEYSLPISNSIVLIVDLYKDKKSGSDLLLFDSLIESVASLSQHMLENNTPHRVIFYDRAHSSVNDMIINDEDTHNELVRMLLRTQLSDEPDLALIDYVNSKENYRCGHIIYISANYSPNAAEVMNDADLAFRYTYLLMTESSRITGELYNEFAQIIPVYPGKLAESIQDLYL